MEHWFNPRTLFALFLFVVWVVRAFKAARDKAAAARSGQPVTRGPRGEPVDPEAEERQRKVRAEVARKIAQRKILMMPSARLEPPPLPRPVEAPEAWVEPPPSPVRAPEPSPVRPPVWAPGPSPILAPEPVALTARQTALAEDFERWSQASGRVSADLLLEHLRAPAELRRAVLMREILGPPVGLRSVERDLRARFNA
jgi:hypothetical protein